MTGSFRSRDGRSERHDGHPPDSVGHLGERRLDTTLDCLSGLALGQLDRAAGTLLGGVCSGGWKPSARSSARIGIVALGHLDDLHALAEAARSAAEPSRPGPGDLLVGDAWVLWCSAIRRAVLDGTLTGVREGLALLSPDRRERWAAWLDDAECGPPDRHALAADPGIKTALLNAWSQIVRTPVPALLPATGSFACAHFEHVTTAVRARDGGDAAAALAGMLMGARWGLSAIPVLWQRPPEGSSLHAADLIQLAVGTVAQGRTDAFGWPGCARYPPDQRDELLVIEHPRDSDVVLGNLVLACSAELAGLGIDAVVSLCRIGRADFADCGAGRDRLQVWLADEPGANAHPHFVVDQAARAIAQLRTEGRRVLVHCAAGKSRTPAVAARYSTLAFGVPPSEALTELQLVLGTKDYLVNPELVRVVHELAGVPWAHRPEPT